MERLQLLESYVCFLRSFGLNPKMLSMDDYFVERDETPVDENGDKRLDECF